MAERDIRDIIGKVCADLDVRARRGTWRRMAPAVIPLAIGTGAAFTACDSETDTRTDTGAQPPYGVAGTGGTGASGGTAGTGGTGGAGGTGGTGVAGMGGHGGAGGVISGGGQGGVAGDPGVDYQAPDP